MRGLELGLVDKLGDIHETLTARFGNKVRIKVFGPKRPLFQMPRFGMSAGHGGVGLGSDLIAAVEDRSIWSRFGL